MDGEEAYQNKEVDRMFWIIYQWLTWLASEFVPYRLAINALKPSLIAKSCFWHNFLHPLLGNAIAPSSDKALSDRLM